MAEDQPQLIQPKPSSLTYDQLDVATIENPGALKPQADLVDSIRVYGVLDPIRVESIRREGRNHTYRIKDGARRHLAVLRFLEEAKAPEFPDPDEVARWETIPAMIEYSDPVAGDATRVVGHATRKPNPIAELEVIEDLLDKGYGESQIHALTKLPIQTIRKRMKLQNLVPTVREATREGKVSPTVAQQVATLSQPRQIELAAKLEEKGKLTAPDVKEVTSAVHQRAVTDAFEGLAPPEEEEPVKSPETPHEYAQFLHALVDGSGLAKEVRMAHRRKEDSKTGYVYADHENPEITWRIKVERWDSHSE